MLKQLKISNYALIDKLDIEFGPGLTIITGETGAGKSIMMGALSLILGDKAESRAIRTVDKKSVIEVVFDIEEYGLQQFFADNDIEYYDGGECILRREISPTGRTRAFVNDTPVTLPVMRALSVQLIDIHSQHSNMLLSSHRYQLSILDNLHPDKSLLARYSREYEKYRRIEARIKELTENNARRKQEEDYLRFQLSQIKELNLQPGEDAELEMKIRFQGLAEETADETVHFLVIAMLCGAHERSIVFINQDDSPLFKLGMQNMRHGVQSTGQGPLPVRSKEALLVVLPELPPVPQLLPVQKGIYPGADKRNLLAQAIHCLLECRSLHVLQRKKNHRVLIHPLLAQPLVVHYLETCKQLPAVLADIEKLGQHGHEQ